MEPLESPNVLRPESPGRADRNRRRIGRRFFSLIGGIAVMTVSATAAAPPASATAANCNGGLSTATTGWGTCKSKVNNSWGGFKVTVNCYYYPQRHAYGMVPQTVQVSCPSWSHVTGVYVTPAAF